MLDWQTKEFLARETHRDNYTVYVRPELVAEIAFSDLAGEPAISGWACVTACAREAVPR